jgi:hypothetical protein
MFVKTAGLLVIPAAFAAVAGCGSSAQQAQPNAAPAGTAIARAAQVPQAAPNGETAPGGPAMHAFTGAQLRRGLLVHVNGASPSVPAEVGPYASLAEVKAAKKSMHEVVVSPARCGQTSLTGFNAPQLAAVPTAIEDFQVGKNGVSEVLMAASGAAASRAVGRQVPVGCSHYNAVVKGEKYAYAIKESWVSGIGDQARVLHVRATGHSQANLWSVVYRGHGIVGAITVAGPDASEAAVSQLGKQSYAYAVTRLS